MGKRRKTRKMKSNTERHYEIAQILGPHGVMTANDLANSMGLTASAVRMRLNEMVNLGYLIKEGGGRGGNTPGEFRIVPGVEVPRPGPGELLSAQRAQQNQHRRPIDSEQPLPLHLREPGEPVDINDIFGMTPQALRDAGNQIATAVPAYSEAIPSPAPVESVVTEIDPEAFFTAAAVLLRQVDRDGQAIVTKNSPIYDLAVRIVDAVA